MQSGLVVNRRYELSQLTVTGGAFGATWNATDRQQADAPVRVVVLEELDPSPENVERFIKLKEKLRKLERCVHLPSLLDADTWNGWLYLVHPRLEGVTLSQWLHTFRSARREVPLAAVREIAVGVCNAIESAHALKPEALHHHGLSTHGVLVNPAAEHLRQLFVLDFALIHFDPPPPTESSQDRLHRTWLAPEQEQIPVRLSPQTDVFQVARLLVECLTASSEPPAGAKSWSRFAEYSPAQMTGALRALRGDLPVAACVELANALQRVPANRPRSVRALRENLLRVWSGAGQEDVTVPLLGDTAPSVVRAPTVAASRPPSPRPPVGAASSVPPRAPAPSATTSSAPPRGNGVTPPEAAPGAQLLAGRYRLGARATDEDGNLVHVAMDTRVGAEVNVVIPADHARRDPAARARFFDTWRLNHMLRTARGGVLQVLDLGEDPRFHLPFVVTESLAGERLDAWVTARGPMFPSLVLECARAVADVLTEAAAAGLLHGDLRPERLQFHAPPSRVLKLRSFGPERVGVHPSGAGLGYFRAPEHVAPQAGLMPSLDVWSFGLLVYYLLAGAVLLRDAEEVTRSYAEGIAWLRPTPSERLLALGVSVTTDFDAWMKQCVQPAAALRFPTVGLAELTLRRLLGTFGSSRGASDSDIAPSIVPPGSGVSVSPVKDPPPEPPAPRPPGASVEIEDVIVPIELKRHQKPLRGLATSADGMRLVSASLDGLVLVWDVNAREVERELRGHDGSVTCVALSADGQRAISGGQDRTVRIWNLRDPQAEPVVLTAHHSLVQGVAMTRNGRYAVTGGADERLCFWDLQHDEERVVWTTRAHTQLVRCVAISPDGQRIATGGEDGAVCLWDARGMQLARFVEHGTPVYCVALSDDGRYVFSGGDDGRIIRWDTTTDTRTAATSHEYRVTALTLTAGGRTLVSASCDPNVKIWDALSGRCLYTLEHHEVAVWCVAAGPEGRWVFSGDSDGLVCVWPLE